MATSQANAASARIYTNPVTSGDSRFRKISIVLLIGHLAALVFGLAGLLIAIPHPELWVNSSYGPRAYNFGMRYGGSLHIVFGAAAMFAYGMYAIGLRKTAIFFACAVPISLGSELIGTSTGEPFGNYRYTNFLGYKIFGHVPFSIPLSWFYVGFATVLIGYELSRRIPFSPRWIYAVTIGAFLLVVWDLVLDPAMAHESLMVKFWQWGQTGSYFGMPGQNFFGWGLTAFVFMLISRLIWRSDPPIDRGIPGIWIPFVVFAANIGFAAALSASVDLWLPILFAVVLGLIPAFMVLVPISDRPDSGQPCTTHAPVVQQG
jgi:uncharacterized membrane protein